MDKKIDLVYLWVDGNDKNWKKEKDKWLRIIKGEKEIYNDATVEARWRDNDELRYSLRSAEKFAPWINHIYIITGFGQVPDWLDTSHPKITIVPHEQIIPADALPTFNSTSIEMCITNIPELSEYFLLANDDMFFNRPLAPEFFYDKKGRAIVWYNNMHCNKRNFGLWLEELSGYSQRLAMTSKLIKDVFNKNYLNTRSAHNIDPYIKSSIISVKNHPMIIQKIEKQLRNKFRTNWEIQRWIFNIYDHIHGKAKFIRARGIKKPKHIIYNLVYKNRIKNSPIYCTDAADGQLAKIKPPLFCINDTELTTDEIRKNNKTFLEMCFPEKSNFEM